MCTLSKLDPLNMFRKQWVKLYLSTLTSTWYLILLMYSIHYIIHRAFGQAIKQL